MPKSSTTDAGASTPVVSGPSAVTARDAVDNKDNSGDQAAVVPPKFFGKSHFIVDNHYPDETRDIFILQNSHVSERSTEENKSVFDVQVRNSVSLRTWLEMVKAHPKPAEKAAIRELRLDIVLADNGFGPDLWQKFHEQFPAVIFKLNAPKGTDTALARLRNEGWVDPAAVASQ